MSYQIPDLSRRTFLKATGALGALAAASGALGGKRCSIWLSRACVC